MTVTTLEVPGERGRRVVHRPLRTPEVNSTYERVELNGALSNPRLQVELTRVAALKRHLAGAVTETETPRRAGAVEPRRMPVLELIARVLDESGRPMRARHIHRSVQPLAGRVVPWSTVIDCLVKNARSADGQLVRVSHGVYARRRT